MKIFITGISGFLGFHLAEALYQKGHTLYALTRKKSELSHLKHIPFHSVEGSLSHCENLPEIFSQMDAILHTAGKIKALSKKEFEETNTQGTQNLVQAALQASPAPKTFIYVSSIAVLNPSLDGDDFCLASKHCHPLSWYGQSKLGGEIALQGLQGKIRSLILRPPVLYGPRDKELLALFKSIKWGFAPLFGKGNHQLSICYIKDVADCLVDLIQNPPLQDEIYCLDDGSLHTWRTLVEEISKVMEKKARLLSIPASLFQMGALFSEAYGQITSRPQIFTRNKILEMKQKSWICGYQKLFKNRGWKPKVPLREGTQLSYNFYQQNKWL